MNKFLFALIISILVFSACRKQEKIDNPFFSKYETPLGIPPFDKIKNSHFIPAFMKGMEDQKKEIRTIVSNTEEPTFENTIKPFIYSGEVLQKVSIVFNELIYANTNDSLDVINQELSTVLSRHSDEIKMNDTLFKRVKAVYDTRGKYTLTDEEKRILDDTYKVFIRSGAALSANDKRRLREVNQELSSLSVRFDQNLNDETNTFKLVIDKEEDLSGLPTDICEQAAAKAKSLEMSGKWVFTLEAPVKNSFLQYSDKRDLREKMFKAYSMRCGKDNDKDNKQIISRLASLRAEKAQILGYKTFADYILEEAMTKTPEKVFSFLIQLWEAALPLTKLEILAEQQMAVNDLMKFKIQPWDWTYYAEKLRKEKYDLNIQDTRPYFKIGNVIDGMFYVAKRLFDLDITSRNDIPKYHPDVNTFEVSRKGHTLGILMIDPYPRPSKMAGVWSGSYSDKFRDVSGKNVCPIVSIVANFHAPTSDKPSLLGPDEAVLLFHEFGHALNVFLSDKEYPTGSQPRDFEEMHSKFMEKWVFEPDVLKVYAKHYQTGELIPEHIVRKIEDSRSFNAGSIIFRSVFASLLDMEYHTQADTTTPVIREIENKILSKYGLPEIPLEKSVSLSHIWSGGYAAGLYSYLWCDMLGTDAFQAFRETGDILNKDIAAKFEKEIFSKRCYGDPVEMYIAFRGREPNIDAFLADRGLKK